LGEQRTRKKTVIGQAGRSKDRPPHGHRLKPVLLAVHEWKIAAQSRAWPVAFELY